MSCFTDESEMLLAWEDFFSVSDPDIIIGYNSARFDIPYLISRAKSLEESLCLGRIKGESQSLFCVLVHIFHRCIHKTKQYALQERIMA